MILRMAGYDRVLSNLQRKGLMNQMLTLTMADNKVLYFPAPDRRWRPKQCKSLCIRLSCRRRPPIWPCSPSQVTDLGHKWRPCPPPADSPTLQSSQGLARHWIDEHVTPVWNGSEQWAVIAASPCKVEAQQSICSVSLRGVSQWIVQKWQGNSITSEILLSSIFSFIFWHVECWTRLIPRYKDGYYPLS